MPIPKAVASSVKTPGFYLMIDLLGAPSNPGTAANRALLIAPKSAAGNIAEDTEVRQCFGAADVAAALGVGTPGHKAASRFFERHPLGALDVIAPAAPAGVAATATQVFTGPATEATTVRLDVHGITVDVPWLAAETATEFAARAAARLASRGDALAVTVAANVGSLVYTAKLAGTWGNDVRLGATVREGGGGVAITDNPATLTGGTTEPDLSLALSQVSTREYRRIVAVLSNADASDATATSNAARLSAHIDEHESGASALLQVGVVGHTGALADVKAGAIARNNPAMQYVFGHGFADLPGELAAAEAGDALRFIAERANYNRIGNAHALVGPRDVVADKLTAAEIEDLLSSGVTPLDVDSLSGVVTVVRPITTHSLSGTAPDFRALDLSDTDGLFSVFADLRTAIPQQFPNCSISPDLPAGADPLPPGVIEVRDVLAFVSSRLRFWATRLGVLDAARLDAVIESGELTVEIDVSDESQVNIFVPAKVLRPLAKFSTVGAKVA